MFREHGYGNKANKNGSSSRCCTLSRVLNRWHCLEGELVCREEWPIRKGQDQKLGSGLYQYCVSSALWLWVNSLTFPIKLFSRCKVEVLPKRDSLFSERVASGKHLSQFNTITVHGIITLNILKGSENWDTERNCISFKYTT